MASSSSDEPRTPLDAFLSAFLKDIDEDAVRPLSEYLAMFPGDDAGISEQYRGFLARGFSHRPGTEDHSADRLGPYRILHQLGRGAQGTVYLAEHIQLHKKVALKVLDTGMATDPTSLERFRRTAEITARLDHPGICTVFDTGEDRGALWIAMRYVEGESLASKISTAKEHATSGSTSFVMFDDRGAEDADQQTKPAGEPPSGPKTWKEIAGVLALFEEAARALHVAHQAGVIHRDIKPGNVMVTKDGNPVILDFGLAQEIEGDHPTLTMTGDLMGTPAYMSPEQLMAHRIRLDGRTDVWSLGVMLYECLTLQRPFDAPTREKLYQTILTREPPDPRRLNHAMPGDLRVVLATALEKDRDRRYQTALDLAEDIRRVRMHEPIVAKPVGPLVPLRRWAQRNPALAAAVFALFLTLAAGLTTAVVLLGARDRALSLLLSESSEKTAALSDAVSQRNAKDAAFRRAEGLRLVAHSATALADDPALALLLGLEASELFPGVETNNALLGALSELRGGQSIIKDAGPIDARGVSEDGGRIFTVSDDEVVQVHDSETGKELSRWTLPGIRPEKVVFVSSDGQRLQTLSEDHVARLWDATSGRLLESVVLAEDANRERVFGFNTDGSRLLTGFDMVESGLRKSTVRLRDSATGTVLANFERSRPAERSHALQAVSFSRDGLSVLAVVDNKATLLDAKTGAEERTIDLGSPGTWFAVFSPDSLWILAMSADGAVRLWTRAGAAGSVLQRPGSRLGSISFSGDGRVMAGSASNTTVRVWDATTWAKPRTIPLSHEAHSIRLDADGSRLLAISEHGREVGVWDVKSGHQMLKARVSDPPSGSMFTPSFTPGSRHFLSPSCSGVERWEAAGREDRRSLPAGRSHRVHGFSSDRRRAITSDEATGVGVWDTEQDRIVTTLKSLPANLGEPVFNEDASLVVASAGDKLCAWDSKSGELRATLTGHTGLISRVRCLDDARAVTGSEDKTVRIWDLPRGRALATLPHPAYIVEIAASPDGRTLAVGCVDGGIHIWDARSGRSITTLSTKARGWPDFKFGLGGRRLVVSGVLDCEPPLYAVDVWDTSTWAPVPLPAATSTIARVLTGETHVLVQASDGGVAICDIGTGTELRLPLDPSRRDQQFVMGSAGRFIAAATVMDGSTEYRNPFEPEPPAIRIWDAATGGLVSDIRPTERVIAVNFVADDRYLITRHQAKSRLWDVTSGREWATLDVDATTFETTPDNRFLTTGSIPGVQWIPLDPASHACLRKPREFMLAELERFGLGTPEARSRAREILGAPSLRRDVFARLRDDLSLPPTVRAAALQEARLIVEGAHSWNGMAWPIVRSPGATKGMLEDALRLAEAACRKDPENRRYWITLGAARYRLQNWAGAIEALQRSDALRKFDQWSSDEVALFAMALVKLGHEAKAATRLSQLQRMPPVLLDPGGLLAEARALIEGPSTETRPEAMTPGTRPSSR